MPSTGYASTDGRWHSSLQQQAQPASCSSGAPRRYRTLLHLHHARERQQLRQAAFAGQLPLRATASGANTHQKKHCEHGVCSHLMSTSPRLPVNCPSMNSSVLASCRFM
jgi:hypothetical protein